MTRTDLPRLSKKSNSGIFGIVLPLVASSALLFTSCKTYQYVSVKSNLYEDEKREFMFENDTAALIYSFSGRDFPLTVTLYNKLRTPLYFDIYSSPVFINDHQINTPFDTEDQVFYIAPQSYATIESYPLSDRMFEMNFPDSLRKQSQVSYVGKWYSFDEISTPVYIRCIMNFSTDKNLTGLIPFDNTFWVSDVMQSTTGPSSFPPHTPYHFFLQKVTGFGKTMNVFGIVSLVVVATAFEAAIGE